MKHFTALIVTPLFPPDIGGPATYAATLMAEIKGDGCRAEVLSFGVVRRYPKIVRHLVFAWLIWKRSRHAEVLLVLDPVSVGLPVYLATRFRARPYVLKVVGDYAWEQGVQRFGVRANLDEFVLMSGRLFHPAVGILRAVQTLVARNAKEIIVPSQYLQGIVASWGVPASRIVVVYNAFHGVGSVPSKKDVRQALALEGRVVVSAGRLVPWKGFRLLIDVVSAMRTRYPDLTLVILGGGPDEAALRAHIQEKGEEENIFLLGQVDHDRVLAYVAGADLFVLNTGYEGFSHQLLEVLALGPPVVTTKVGGNVELIADDKTGRLVPYHDEAAMMEAMTFMLEHPKEAHRMAVAGQEFVSSFSVSRMIAETRAVLVRAGHSTKVA